MALLSAALLYRFGISISTGTYFIFCAALVVIIFIDIHQFDNITKMYTAKELIAFLDSVYNQFDFYCDQYGIQKIESVGKRYMACGGLMSADKKIDSVFLNKHHSVRVTDFALEITNYAKQVFLKNG